MSHVPANRAISPGRSDLPELPLIQKRDRILVLAPHEDDETLGAGGIIQQAVAAGASIRIVYLTYGDHNELAFLLYRKRPWSNAKTNEIMGEIRRREAIKAMAYLGVPTSQLIFLGYPDGGTLNIWKKHWGNAPPLRSAATHTEQVPYPDAFSYQKAHKGEEIVADIERQLLEFRPTHIFVTQPVDGHPDHRAFYLFLQVALLNIEKKLPLPQVLAYPIHIGTWPYPHSYRPESWLPFPKPLTDTNTWYTSELSSEQVKRKYEAILLYKSQTADSLSWLSAFARRNELFAVLSPVQLQQQAWSSIYRTVARPETPAYEKPVPTGHVETVAYRESSNDLLIRITLRQPIERELGLSAYVFGYRYDQSFTAMPKIRIEWVLGRVYATDSDDKVFLKELTVKTEGSEITIMIPWEILGQPETIFAQIQGLVGGIPISQTGWQVLSRETRTEAADSK